MADITGADLGYKPLADLYQKILSSIPTETINYTPVTVQEQSLDDISSKVNAYLKPYYDAAIKARQDQATANRAAIDADAASRGMGASTFVTDTKSRQMNSAAADIAGIRGQQNATLAERVQAYYQNYLASKQTADLANAQNSLETAKYNSAIRASAEQDAYARAKELLAYTDLGSSGGSSSRSSSPKGDEEPITYISNATPEMVKKLMANISTSLATTSSQKKVSAASYANTLAKTALGK